MPTHDECRFCGGGYPVADSEAEFDPEYYCSIVCERLAYDADRSTDDMERRLAHITSGQGEKS